MSGLNPQANGAEILSTHRLILDFPLIELPFNTGDDAGFPSMNQSLNLSKNFYQISHGWMIDMLKGRPAWQTLFSIAAFDLITTWTPLGVSWLHEEWHRAVLRRRGIESYNEVYDLNFFEETISVSHVKDEDLIRLKEAHPQEMVRLHAAGIEAQYEMNLALEKDQFFSKTYVLEDMLLWINYLNSIFYINLCASNEADEMTDEMTAEEGLDISDRDFTGLDFTAYVYDLFRPEEPYQARGVHPSGKGVDRYIRYSDLTHEEQDYLKLQRNLSLLNLVNPFLFHKHRFYGNGFVWNLTLRHHLTPFGYAVSTHFFFKKNPFDSLIKCHFYNNKTKTFPGVEVEIIRLPVEIWRRTCDASFRVGLWMQPYDQRFRVNRSTPGGLVAVKVATPVSTHMALYMEIEEKTKGWVSGSPYLDENCNVILGVIFR